MLKKAKWLTMLALFVSSSAQSSPVDRPNLETSTKQKPDFQKLRKVKVYSLSGHEYVSLVLFKKNKKKQTNQDIIDISYK